MIMIEGWVKMNSLVDTKNEWTVHLFNKHIPVKAEQKGNKINRQTNDKRGMEIWEDGCLTRTQDEGWLH